MSFARLFRQIHYWGSLLLIVTTLVVAATGILLILKKDFAALQPPTLDGQTAGLSDAPLSALLAAVATTPGYAHVTWQDVDRIDVRPSNGVAKVVLADRTELQVDLHTLQVLQIGYRTSDLIETIHDGSFFGAWGKYLLSLPTGIGLIIAWATGVYLFVLPFLVRRRKRSRRVAGEAA